ncbi:hypothetical protein MOX02_61880 [Methylobacterium oxalidis]|uniref:Uncharacterized protein n=1 Tax=Methylobacterium oxalidis TaxID=944322 RepID=A0A512JDW7_9HYPH|nr:hypothetical protein MOX02_61880 [Methylobacterium oxalidis]GLS62244.1 hypothetical protein GCM10007888_06250 [Methylobacterium oxalidis]
MSDWLIFPPTDYVLQGTKSLSFVVFHLVALPVMSQQMLPCASHYTFAKARSDGEQKVCGSAPTPGMAPPA